MLKLLTDYQYALIFLGTVIVLFLAFIISNEKHKNIVLLLTGIIAAFFTMFFSFGNNKKEQMWRRKFDSVETINNKNILQLRNEVTGGNEIPRLYVAAVKAIYNDKSGAACYDLSIYIENQGNYAITNLKFSMEDSYSSLVRKYVEMKVADGNAYHETQKLKFRDVEEKYNDFKVKQEAYRIEPKATRLIYETAIACDYSELNPELKNKGMDVYYPIAIEWNNGTLNFDIQLTVNNQTLTINKCTAIFKGTNIDTNKCFRSWIADSPEIMMLEDDPDK